MIDCMTCGCAVCLCDLVKTPKEDIIPLDIIPLHLNHWLYKRARDLTEQVRVEQILKGAAKYPVPLGDAEWTPQQLIHHAMQENVDQAHYLTRLLVEIERLTELLGKYQEKYGMINEKE